MYFFSSNSPSSDFFWKIEKPLTPKYIEVSMYEITFEFRIVINNQEVNQDFWIKIERY